MLTTKLNYQRIMALNPTVYCIITNTLGQTFDLVEHPTQGDEHTVIIMYHAEKLAVDSEFWDTEDMESNSDYMPVYIYGDMHLAYEIDEADLKPSTIEQPIADKATQNNLEIDAMANIGQCATLLTEALKNGSSFKVEDLDSALLMIGNMVKKRLTEQ